MNDKVCAVVVTYNRKNLLIECLESLRKQSRPIQGIYLIDNASTDRTPELLLEKGYLRELPPKNLNEPWEKEFAIQNLTDGNEIKLHYVKMHENTGGADGFYEGVKRGYEKGYDWLWLMDDDVEAKESCLEKLIYYQEKGKCLLPRRYYQDGSVYQFSPQYNLINFRASHDSYKELLFNEFVEINTVTFEGVLLNKSIIREIGYPDKLFFINWDDAEYGIRIAHCTKILIIKDATMIRKIKKESLKRGIFGIKVYMKRREFLQKHFGENIMLYEICF
jgi:GT2 family glycosyltransferase